MKSENKMLPSVRPKTRSKLQFYHLFCILHSLTHQTPKLPSYRNQLIGFYMVATLAPNELIMHQITISLLHKKQRG